MSDKRDRAVRKAPFDKQRSNEMRPVEQLPAKSKGSVDSHEHWGLFESSRPRQFGSSPSPSPSSSSSSSFITMDGNKPDSVEAYGSWWRRRIIGSHL